MGCYSDEAMNHNPDPLRPWWESFPYSAVKAELEEVQSQMNILSQRFGELSDVIRLYERHVSMLPADSVQAREREAIAPPEPARPTLRSAISQVMHSDARDWPTDDLRKALIGRGWLREDDQGKANLLSMLSVMTSKGQLERVRTGVYRLPGTNLYVRTVVEP